MRAEPLRCPEDVLGWIPWYPDQGLAAAERGAVEAHAANCPGCRAEIAMLLGEAEPEYQAPAPDAALARVLERIDALQAPRAVRPPARARETRIGRRARVLAAAGLAAACVAAGALGAAAWLRDATPVYRSAAGPAPAADAAGSTLLDVVFGDDVEIGRIRDALRALHAEVVSGPTELGRYRVRLPAGEDALAAARALGPGGAGVAVFAEPVPR